MADNRMWLLHRPSGKAVMLGKRFGPEWYTKHDHLSEMLTALFDQTEGDDFCLAMEDCEDAPEAFDNWEYTEPGQSVITHLRIKK